MGVFFVKKRILKTVLIVIGVLALLFLALQGFVRFEEIKRAKAPGNVAAYDVVNQETHTPSVLTGKTILFLGSSVTDGAAATGQSFVELFEQLDGVHAIKEAKSGTTLVDKLTFYAMLAFGNGDSYIKRLKDIDPATPVDCVVCQLSTNDATMKLPLGEVSLSENLSAFDTKTVTGAMEYIIRYCRDTWSCPVVFYTGAYYESDAYAAMVKRLYNLKEKWDIGVIDLYTDADFNAIDKETYDLYMYDKIHPTKAGYLNWWMPKMEAELTKLLETEE